MPKIPTNYFAGFDSMMGDSRTLNLRIHFPKANMSKVMKFDAQLTVAEACERIRNQVRESDLADDAKECGLFLPHEDNKKGLWLDNARTLEHYILRNGDTVQYRYRYRSLVIRTLDDTKKRLRVDDSKSVAELMLLICTRMGIYNHDEYSLVREHDEHHADRTSSSTLRQRHQPLSTSTLGRDQEKMEKLRRKLHTDDDMDWLNPSQSLRQQGIEEDEVLLLKRRYFFSDMNVDARDPIQLNLLYVQLKDAILNGTHPVSPEEAVQLAAYQCQIHFSDNAPDRFKSRLLDLKEFLPKEYSRIRGIEKKIFQHHEDLIGMSEIDAKVKYCQFCRSLKTYGITFFLVKERIKGKTRLIPRLLGITKDSVIRLDENTKKVLKTWPLTSISKWAASLHAFTMDFGEYSPDECYTAQTSEGEQISQLIAGYIDIILKKQKAKDHPGLQGDEESAMYEENVQAERAVIVQHQRMPSAARHPGSGGDTFIAGGMTVDEEVYHTDSSNQFAQAPSNGWSYGQMEQQQPLPYCISSSTSFADGGGSAPRPLSPDNFMTGGTHVYHYQTVSPTQRALLVSIDDNVERLQSAKEQLHIDPSSERVVYGVGTDEASQRWLTETMSASQAKVTDEVGAMNAAVAQALRSANRPNESTLRDRDEGDQMMTMQQSFRVVTIHFPAFVDDVKRVAELRREAGALRAVQVSQPLVMEHAEESSQNLLSAARNVADAFTDLLQSARPLATIQAQDVLLDGGSSTDGLTQNQQVIETTTSETTTTTRKALIEAASKVGEASNDLLRHVMHEDPNDTDEPVYALFTEEERVYQDELLALAKNVANATAGLVMKARDLAKLTTVDPEMQQRVIDAVTKTGSSTRQLVACTKVLAPTIHQPLCQHQLSEAAHEVTWAVDDVVQTSRATGISREDLPIEEVQLMQLAVSDTESAATKVRDALDQLNAHLGKASVKAYDDDVLDNFQMAYETLVQQYTHDGQRMVTAARRMAQIAAQLSNDLKLEAESCPPGTLDDNGEERHLRLFNAAKLLADVTTVQVEAAKNCAQDPTNLDLQIELHEAATKLHATAHSAASEMFYARLLLNLQSAARSTVTASTQLVNVGRVAVGQSRGNVYQVKNDGMRVNSLIPHTLSCIRESRKSPDDLLAQMELFEACEEIIQPCEALVRSSQSVAPTVSDPTTQVALENSTAQLAVAVNVLHQVLGRIRPFTSSLQLDAALERLARLVREVDNVAESYSNNTLAPLPNEKIEDCMHWLSVGVRNASSSCTDLQSTIEGMHNNDPEIVQRPNLCGPQATGMAASMTSVVRATRGIVAAPKESTNPVGPSFSPPNQATCLALISDIRYSTQRAYELVKAGSDARAAYESKQPPILATIVSHTQHVADQFLSAISRVLRCIPGHREINQAFEVVEKRKLQLDDLQHERPTARKVHWVEPNVYESNQAELTKVAVEFNQATLDFASSTAPSLFLRSAPRFSGAYDQLAEKTIELSTSCPRPLNERIPQQAPAADQEIVSKMIVVSDNTHLLVTNAAVACAHGDDANARVRFQDASRNVTESINQLLNVCTSGSAAAGGMLDNRDIDMAIGRLEALRPLLERPESALNRNNYNQCYDSVSNSIQYIVEGLRNMSSSSKQQSAGAFGEAVNTFTDSTCRVVEEAAQAAYLIRQSAQGPDSAVVTSMPINAHLFSLAQSEIHSASDAISNPNIASVELISQSSRLATYAKVLCEACNKVSSNTADPSARQDLNNMTRNTMHSLTALIKDYAHLSQSDSSAVAPVAHADVNTANKNVDQLVHLVMTGPYDMSSAQSISLPRDQEASYVPVTSAGLGCLDASQQVLLAAKECYSNSSQSTAQYSGAGKALSDNIKSLVNTMQSNAPGRRECDQVILHIRQLKAELQQAKMAQMNAQLKPRLDLSQETCHRQLISASRNLIDIAPELVRVSKCDPGNLGSTVIALDSQLPVLTSGAIGAASHSLSSTSQLALLEHASAVLESADQVVNAAGECVADPRALLRHTQLDEGEKNLRESCEDLLSIIGDSMSRQGQVNALIGSINRSIQLIESPVQQSPGNTRFADYQARLLRIAQHMQQLTQDIQIRAQQPQMSTGDGLAPLAHTLTQEFNELSHTCKLAISTLPDMGEVGRLRAAVKAVGYSTADLVTTTSVDVSSPSARRSLVEIDRRADRLDVRLGELINLLAIQGPLTQTCLQSANTVSGIIADLDTTILFASSGTLHPPVRDDIDAFMANDRLGLFDQPALGDSSLVDAGGFIPLSESIERTARALVDDTQSLVSGTGSEQTRLANSTHVAVERIAQLAEAVKKGAAVIGPGQPDTQVELLKGCRSVAVDLREILLALSKVEDCPPTDPVHEDVRTRRQAIVNSTNQLVRLLQAISADQNRGCRALDTAARFCRHQAEQLGATPSGSRRTLTRNASLASCASSRVTRYLASDDLAKSVGRPVQQAVACVMQARNTKHGPDVLAAANVTRDVVAETTQFTKTLYNYGGAPLESRDRCSAMAKELALQFARLLDSLKVVVSTDQQRPTTSSPPNELTTTARRIAEVSNELLQVLDSLREGPRLVMYFQASGPEWRDVAEKYLGRHAAYHHHHGPCSHGGIDPSSILAQPVCYPSSSSNLGLSNTTLSDDTVEQTDEAESRIRAAVAGLDSTIAAALSRTDAPARNLPLLQAVRKAVLTTGKLIQTAHSLGLAPPTDASDRAQHAPGGSRRSATSVALWRTEMTLALAIQHLVQSASLLYSSQRSSTLEEDVSSLLIVTPRLSPSRERLLAAIRQVAASSAQLIISAKSKRLKLPQDDLDKLRASGQSVKEATDYLSEFVQQDSSLSHQHGSGIRVRPSLYSKNGASTSTSAEQS